MDSKNKIFATQKTQSEEILKEVNKST